jgi:hypothetical protein
VAQSATLTAHLITIGSQILLKVISASELLFSLVCDISDEGAPLQRAKNSLGGALGV